ncbi:MAG: DUF5689 domain-containing protein [Bacteroidales bacterium]|nr:DUF5689 domain-containing protein [Bacteroidales bacterium]
MKNIINITAIITLIVIMFSGCVKENFDLTPEKIYSVDFDANTTISELKEMFSSTEIIDTNIIIKGTVISDDSHGNFYEELVIQDSTGGIEIQIDKSDLFKSYPVGQMVYIKCKGLVISEYKGVKQLTYMTNGSSDKFPESAVDQYLFKSGEGLPIVPKTVEIADLSDEHINTLIKLEGVEFIENDIDTTFADPGDDASRTITDFAENTLIVRTSEYADFAYDNIPDGNGYIIAVYAVYNDDKQIYIRDINEIDLTGERINRSYLIDEGFDDDLGEFSAYSVVGSQGWYHEPDYDNGCALMSGYSGSPQDNEDWLISSSLDMSALNDALLMFTHAGSLYGSTWDNTSIQISTDYDGVSNPSTTGTWTEIKDYEKPTSWTFIPSGSIDMKSYCGSSNVYIAFKYISDTSAALKWEVGSVKIIVQ